MGGGPDFPMTNHCGRAPAGGNGVKGVILEVLVVKVLQIWQCSLGKKETK